MRTVRTSLRFCNTFKHLKFQNDNILSLLLVLDVCILNYIILHRPYSVINVTKLTKKQIKIDKFNSLYINNNTNTIH